MINKSKTIHLLSGSRPSSMFSNHKNCHDFQAVYPFIQTQQKTTAGGYWISKGLVFRNCKLIMQCVQVLLTLKHVQVWNWTVHRVHTNLTIFAAESEKHCVTGKFSLQTSRLLSFMPHSFCSFGCFNPWTVLECKRQQSSTHRQVQKVSWSPKWHPQTDKKKTDSESMFRSRRILEQSSTSLSMELGPWRQR